MGGLKKGKGSNKSKPGKGREGVGKGKDLKRQQDEWPRELQGPPQERIAAVRPFWASLPQEKRIEVLTLSLEDLRARAKEITDRQRKQAAAEEAEFAAEHPHTAITAGSREPTLEDVLEEGIKRLKEKETWKLWQWPSNGRNFTEPVSFRTWVVQEALEESLRKLVPQDDSRGPEKPAEAGLRMRMMDLLQKVQQNTRQVQEEMVYPKRGGKGQRATPDQIHNALRDTNIEMITTMLRELEKEHEFLYQSVLLPVTSFICEILKHPGRESSRTDVHYDDFEKLPQDEVSRICEWMTEKIDGFATKLKAEPKDVDEQHQQDQQEEEGIGDVDLFSLTEDRTALTVNAKWLQHLQERLLGEDGHPRKAVRGEDEAKMGLVLEWVYGTIVSTAEKSRDGAKRPLGGRPPNVMQAFDQLVQALREQEGWEDRAKLSKDLLNEMLASRKEAVSLRDKGYDIRPIVPPEEGVPADLPESVIIQLLEREVLLTRAKLHALHYEQIVADKKLRSLKNELRQGEPEFERLKRELEEMKNQPRGLEGTFRTQAEMERHRAQLADQAIEEQLEVQTAFREHGNKLQKIYEGRQRTEVEMARREQEIKQLNGWKGTVQSLIDRFMELSAPVDENLVVSDEAAAALRRNDNPREKLRDHFQKDVRRQLYTLDDDVTFFDWIKHELKSVEKRLEDGRVALQHFMMFLINVACDDPGATIGVQLALPLLQERLDAKAMDHADYLAGKAARELIETEELKAQQEQAEKEKRQKQKLKLKEKARSEKERLAAEKEAKERAERDMEEEEERLRAEEQEAERLRMLVEKERLRKEEDEALEARRKLLCNDSGRLDFNGQQEGNMPPQELDDAPSVASLLESQDFEKTSRRGSSQEISDYGDDELQGTMSQQPGGEDGFQSIAPPQSQRKVLSHNRRRSHVGEAPSSNNAKEGAATPRMNGRVFNTQPKAVPLRRTERDNARAVPITSTVQGPKQGSDPIGRKSGVNGYRKENTSEPTPSGPQAKDLEKRPRTSAAKAKTRLMEQPDASGDIQSHAAAGRLDSQNKRKHVFVDEKSCGAPDLQNEQGVAQQEEHVVQATSIDEVAKSSGESGQQQRQRNMLPVYPNPVVNSDSTRVRDAAASAMPSDTLPVESSSASDESTSAPAPQLLASLPGEVAPVLDNNALSYGSSAAVSAIPLQLKAFETAKGTTSVSEGLKGGDHVATPSKGHVHAAGRSLALSADSAAAKLPRQSPRAVPVGQAGPLPESPNAVIVVPEKSAARDSQLDSHFVEGQNVVVPTSSRPQLNTNQGSSLQPEGGFHQPNGMLPRSLGGHAQNGLFLQDHHNSASSTGSLIVGHPMPSPPAPAAAMKEVGDYMSDTPLSRMPHQPPLPLSSGPANGYGQLALGPRGLLSPPMHLSSRGLQDLPQTSMAMSASGDIHGGPAFVPPQVLVQVSNHLGRHALARPMQAHGHNGPGQSVNVGGPQIPGSHMFPFPQGNQGQYMGGHRGVSHGPSQQLHPSYNGGQQIVSSNRAGSPTHPNPSIRMPNQFFPPGAPANHMMTQVPGPPGGPNRDGFMHGPPGVAFMPHHIQGHVLGLPMVQPRSPSMQPYMVGSNSALPSMPGILPAPISGGPVSHSPAGSFVGSGNVGNMSGPSKASFQPSGRGSTPPPRRSGLGRGSALRYDAQEFVPSSGSGRGLRGSLSQKPRESPEQLRRLAHRELTAAPVYEDRVRTGAPGGVHSLKETPDAHVAISSWMPVGNSLQRNSAGNNASRQVGQPKLDLSSTSTDTRSNTTSQAGRGSEGKLGEMRSQKGSPVAVNPRVSKHGNISPTSTQSLQTAAADGKELCTTSVTQPLTMANGMPDEQESEVPNDVGTGNVQQPTAEYTIAGVQRTEHKLSSFQALVSSSNGDSTPTTVGRVGESRTSAGSVPVRRISSTGSVTSSSLTTSHVAGGEKKKVGRGQDVLASLKLVRGLRNEAGFNNCFLNVVIQSLWCLRSFRHDLLALNPEVFVKAGHPVEDLNVLIALRDIFSTFAKPVDLVPSQNGKPKREDHCNDDMDMAASQYNSGDHSTRWASLSVSPTELRKALSSLNKTAVQFNESDMHDASEVLNEIFNSLHRAECGTLREGAMDPQLPQTLRVPVSSANGRAAPLTDSKPMSIVQNLFGLEVQVPSRIEGDEVPMPNKRSKANGGWQEQTSRFSAKGHVSQSSSVAAQSQQKKTRDSGFVEVLQYMKYFHLVPAQGLRTAYERKVGDFEVMLQYAERADGLSQGLGSSESRSGPLDIMLLRTPAVFTLALVWDSPQATGEAIRSTVHALKTELHVSKYFKSVPSSSAAHGLRCVVCYLRHHYQVYVLNEELDQWLLFDDTNINRVGDWEDVVASMIASRHQPSLLFYEDPCREQSQSRGSP
eukprot:jgi/Botrbrau1/18428/Bobra.0072s0020.2